MSIKVTINLDIEPITGDKFNRILAERNKDYQTFEQSLIKCLQFLRNDIDEQYKEIKKDIKNENLFN